MNLNPANRNIMFNSITNPSYLLAIGHQVSPFVSLYKLNGTNAPIKQDNLATLPSIRVRGVDFSKDYFVAVQEGASPPVVVYTRRYNNILFSHTQDVPLSTTVAYSVRFKPNSSIYAVAYSASPFVAVLDASKTGTAAHVQIGLTGLATISSDAVFSPDGQYLAVAVFTTNALRIYNTSNWSLNTTLNHAGSGTGVAFSPDGKYLALATNGTPFLYVYNTSNWSSVTINGGNPPGASYGVDFSKDGKILAVASYTTPFLARYTTSDWTKMSDVAAAPVGRTRRVRFSNDGRYMSVASDNQTPFINVYTYPDFVKLDLPITIPTGGAEDVAFNF